MKVKEKEVFETKLKEIEKREYGEINEKDKEGVTMKPILKEKIREGDEETKKMIKEIDKNLTEKLR